ncbi:MAG TPA: CPBP family intramembrane glutamic endopeptidase [Solirubrobacterales bacterium]|nr:CPBP family intramembrane glutamic endopeptidase [Solirubrobacterales bacterium]
MEPSPNDPAAAPASDGRLLPAPAWGPMRVLAGLLVMLLGVLIAGSLASLVDPDVETLGATLALQAIVAAVFLGIAFYAANPAPGPAAPSALGLRAPLRPAIKVAVAAYLVYIACALVINAALEPEQEDIARDLGLGEGVLGSIAAGFLIIVAASVTEEVFFRGFVFAGLRSRMPFVVAASISAVIWALLHFNPDNPAGSWGVVVQLTVLGIALAWVYERTGSIWPSIGIHAVNNALAFAILAS